MNEQTSPLSELNGSTGLGMAPAYENQSNMDLAGSIPTSFVPNEVDKRATRWLVFAGDLITPRQKRERPDLAIGGEYLGQQYMTLVRSKGLLRRCQLTPLEIGYDFLNSELLGDNINGIQVVQQVEHSTEGMRTPHKAPTLNAIEVFPGDEIKGLLHREHNNAGKGFVEVDALRGVTFDDVMAAGIQNFIFPNRRAIMAGAEPIENKVRVLMEHLEARKKATNDAQIQAVCDAYLESCARYKRWGTDYLKVSAQLIRTPAHQGFVHSYSAEAEMLFDQLELTREDALRMAPTAAAPSAAVSDPEVKAILQQMANLQELMIKNGMAGVVQAPVAETPAPEAKTAVPVTPHADPQPQHTDSAPDPAVAANPVRTAPVLPNSAVVQDYVGEDLDPAKCTALTRSGKQCNVDRAPDSDRCLHPAHVR